jgi:choice-of-anchor C domain-containing protein
MKKIALATLALLALPTTANAAAFMNGSFENSAVNPGTFTTLGAGATDINGWTVGGNSVDYIGTYWNAADGARSIDLAGNGPGSISQTFDTVAGKTYKVSFAMAGNTDGSPTVKTLLVSGDASQNFSFDTTGASRSDMGWVTKTFTFIANGKSSTLTFAAGDSGPYGAALDNVAVSAVPEPAAWALMITGFGMVGGAMRTRRRKAFAAA